MIVSAASLSTDSHKRLSTGDHVLDNLLHGGINVGGITEVYGESAVGKSQFCLRLALTVQLPEDQGGLDANCCYICTEDTFPIRRLHSLCESMAFEYGKHRPTLDRVFLTHIFDQDSQQQILHYQLPLLVEYYNVKLIVIDSIAGNFRYGRGNNDTELLQATDSAQDLYKRAKEIHSLGLLLKKIAHKHSVAVLCVNQVTSSISGNDDDDDTLIPSLGLSWSHLVNTRLQMSKCSEYKELRVIFSQYLKPSSIRYTITPTGISGVSHPADDGNQRSEASS